MFLFRLSFSLRRVVMAFIDGIHKSNGFDVHHRLHGLTQIDNYFIENPVKESVSIRMNSYESVLIRVICGETSSKLPSAVSGRLAKLAKPFVKVV